MGAKLIIWLFTTEYGSTPGGIATYVHNFQDMCENSNFELKLFYRHPTKEPKRERVSDNVEIIHFEAVTPFSPHACRRIGQSGLQVAFETLHVFEQACKVMERPDFIEVQDYMGMGYFLLAQKRALLEPAASIPIVITAHNPSFNIQSPEPYRLPRYFDCEMERFCFVAADQVRYPSAHIRQRLESQFERPAPGVVIPHPVARKRLFPSFYARGTGGTLGFIGRLQAHKGVDLLVSAFAECDLSREGYKLQVFGRDAIHPYLKTSMGTYLKRRYSGLACRGDIVFKGAYRRHELKSIIQDIDIVLLPYLEESFSYTFVETLSCGKLPLISAGGGQQELMAPELGDLYVTDFAKPATFKASLDRIALLSDAEREQHWNIAVQYVMEKCDLPVVAGQVQASLVALRHQVPAISYPFVSATATRSLATDEAVRQELVAQVTVPQQPGLLSVVVPFFNMAAYVDATIVSILDSEYRNLEIIIVDDGSSDPAALQALERIQAHNSGKVKIVRIPNGGLANARNVGADNANGEFIAFLDPDDVVEPSYFAAALRIMTTYRNVDFVGAWTYQFDEGDHFWITFNPEFPYHLYHNMINSSSIIVKKAAFLAAGRNDPRYIYGMEDYNATICLLKHGCRGMVIPRPLFGHRKRTGSMSNLFSTSSQGFLYRLLRQDHEAIYTRHALELEQLASVNGHGALVANPTYPLTGGGHYQETQDFLRARVAESRSLGDKAAQMLALEELVACDPGHVDILIDYSRLLLETGRYAEAAQMFGQAETMYIERDRDPFWPIYHQLESQMLGRDLAAFEATLPRFLQFERRCHSPLVTLRTKCIGTGGIDQMIILIARTAWTLYPDSVDDALEFVSVALRNQVYDGDVYKAAQVGRNRGGYWPNYHMLHAAVATGDLVTAYEARHMLLNASDRDDNRLVGDFRFMFDRLMTAGRREEAINLWKLIAVGFQSVSVLHRKQLISHWVAFGLEVSQSFFHEGEENRAARASIAALALEIIKIDSTQWMPFFFYGRYLQIDRNDHARAISYLETAYAQSGELWAGLHLVTAYAHVGEADRVHQMMTQFRHSFGRTDDIMFTSQRLAEIMR